MKILVTGSTGFVGSALCDYLSAISDFDVIGTGRNVNHNSSRLFQYVPIDYSRPFTDWSAALDKVDVVVHLAARAHVISDSSLNPLAEFRIVNVEGTLTLAKQALESGVKRFVFLSSIGANGSFTEDEPFTEKNLPNPQAEYAISKLEAEEALKALFKETSIELVIIRPPLVYAAHAPGNFERLLKLTATGVPLPFGLVRNKRSMIALENLLDFIFLCIKHPNAANELFVVSDEGLISTPDLIKLIALGMGRNSYMIPVPVSVLRLLASSVGRVNVFTQLCGSLVVDPDKAIQLLGWKPPLTTEQALIKAGREYIKV